MKLTKKEALEKTIEMWTWLAEHPEASKKDYCKENNIVNRPFCGCYCCQYASEQNSLLPNTENKIRCGHCPIWNVSNLCTTYNSPYYSYHSAHWHQKLGPQMRYTTELSYRNKTKYALEIVALAKEKLKELEGD